MKPSNLDEQKLRLAVSVAEFGILEIDYLNGTAILDERAGALLGLPANVEVSREMVHGRFHPDDHHMIEDEVARSLDPNGNGEFVLQHRILRIDGTIRWLNVRKRIRFEEQSGQRIPVSGMVAIADITGQKKFEQSLREAKEAAEAANRSRGEFLANMSHEIRTPMAAIIGHADILKDHLDDPDNQQVVETIRRNGSFLLSILNDILDLSKIDAGKFEVEKRPVRPDAVIGDVRSLMDVRASEKELPLKVEFEGPIPATIETDPVRLRQILLNLVGNAIKFTDRGEVRLSVRFNKNTQRLSFDVQDTGIGIPEEKLDDLFEPFIQADSTSTRSFGGTGLGLAICKRLAEALGGDVVVESELGIGSRFTLSLKVEEAGQLVEPNLNVQSPAESKAHELRLAAKALVVDDRRDIRYLAEHFIEQAGGEVVTATNGLEAVKIVMSEEGKDIDVIVMDMQMPVMDGYAAATELRKLGCKTPIIALTANAMKSDRDECLAAGCTDYTTKPLDSRKLVELIDRLTTS
jgi:signal transduction histidine kinase/ActR/RegA family two-component response regulator